MWCAMTCYQPGAPYGGDQFQKLMQLLLIGDSNFRGAHSIVGGAKTASKQKAKTFSPRIEEIMNQRNPMYFDAATMTYGSYCGNNVVFEPAPPTNLEMWDDADADGQSLSTRDKDGDHESAGGHVSAHCRPLTLNRNNKYGLFMGTTQHSNQHPNDSIQGNIGVGFGFLPLSIIDFMSKAGLIDNFSGQTAEDGVPKNNASYVYKNCGVDTVGSCWEIGSVTRNDGPCMQSGNKLAAYFGLYYYKDCERSDFNWEVYEHSAAGVHTVRLRCPNPMYGRPNWYNEKIVNPFEQRETTEVLYVYEPLNEFN